uniref:Uncharacterized protein n=1 Tax=Chromera velia CCMP2878 TaxID=1169474 RepID=A0A0G4G476_9ALVE|eukprot:Cvel_20212.t1-p1 / transcript=Cvel_20212.t1 / gene=Cvel_20212 / organism=Chromera_velia_CCMP2878 / gene_product=hypothetical protein / transcript_product=hypothetical protein / location=Cvel_scaffold1798:33419-37778(-) / protein_length=438 / sequence_SO=supercontig / SO=protein_coding / is_pseudo=false
MYAPYSVPPERSAVRHRYSYPYAPNAGDIFGTSPEDADSLEKEVQKPLIRRDRPPHWLPWALGATFGLLCLLGIASLGSHETSLERPSDRRSRQQRPSVPSLKPEVPGEVLGAGERGGSDLPSNQKRELQTKTVNLLHEQPNRRVSGSASGEASSSSSSSSSSGVDLKEAERKKNRQEVIKMAVKDVAKQMKEGNLSPAEESFFLHALGLEVLAERENEKGNPLMGTGIKPESFLKEAERQIWREGMLKQEALRIESIVDAIQGVALQVAEAGLTREQERQFVEQVERDLEWDSAHPWADHEGHAPEVGGGGSLTDSKLQIVMRASHKLARTAASKLLEAEKVLLVDALKAEIEAQKGNGNWGGNGKEREGKREKKERGKGRRGRGRGGKLRGGAAAEKVRLSALLLQARKVANNIGDQLTEEERDFFVKSLEEETKA